MRWSNSPTHIISGIIRLAPSCAPQPKWQGSIALAEFLTDRQHALRDQVAHFEKRALICSGISDRKCGLTLGAAIPA
jgi:hypothetical protein